MMVFNYVQITHRSNIGESKKSANSYYIALVYFQTGDNLIIYMLEHILSLQYT